MDHKDKEIKNELIKTEIKQELKTSRKVSKNDI